MEGINALTPSSHGGDIPNNPLDYTSEAHPNVLKNPSTYEWKESSHNIQLTHVHHGWVKPFP